MSVILSKKILQLSFRRLITRLSIATWVAAMPIAVALRSTAQVSAVPLVEFSDTQGYWAAACIERMGGSGYMKGYANRRFLPNNPISRAEYAAVMMAVYINLPKVRNAPQFTDVPTGFWAQDAISQAYERGLLDGYPNRQFKPYDPISRAQAITTLANAEGLDNLVETEAILNRLYVDQGEILPYARGAIAAATERRLVVNYPTVEELRPNDSLVRGEVAAMLCQAITVGIDYRYNVPSEYVVTVVNRWRDRFVMPASDSTLAFDRHGLAVKMGDYDETGIARWGIVDRNGQWVIEPRFERLNRFSDGLAIGRTPENPQIYEVIDRQGQTVFSTERHLEDFSDGLAIFIDENGLKGFVDKTGKVVIPAQFFNAAPFSDGLARVSKIDEQGYGGDQYGFIDKTGQVVIPLRYKAIQETFKEGLIGAQVEDSQLWGYLDKTEAWAIAPQFTAVQPFSEGLAGATKSPVTGPTTGPTAGPITAERWGFIDRTGAFVIAPQYFAPDFVYDEASGAFFKQNAVLPFSEGFASVRLGSAVGLIDRSGQWRISPTDFEGLITEIGTVQGGIVNVQIGGDGAYVKVAQP